MSTKSTKKESETLPSPLTNATSQQLNNNDRETNKIKSVKTNRNQISANWNTLANTILPTKSRSPAKKKVGALNKNSVIALDCEMVGIGVNGRDHMLARVSIVNDKGDIIMDKYVKPTQPVVDYRTQFSGITPLHLENAHNFKDVQAEVIRIKNNRILVGHALHNDLKVLKLEHPKRYIRDTSLYKKFREFSEGRTPALRLLSNCILDYDIQTGAHCSVEDARAAMAIYLKFVKQWERSMAHYF